MPVLPVLRLSFDLPIGISYVTHLRRTARCLVEHLGISKSDADDIELVLGELATNVVRHAGGDGYRVEIEFCEDRATVTMIVTDRGDGLIPKDLPEPGSLRTDTLLAGVTTAIAPASPDDRIGGFGFPLIRAVMDRVEIAPNAPQGTIVRAIKHLGQVFTFTDTVCSDPVRVGQA